MENNCREVVHVYPFNDKWKHTIQGTSCYCNPRIQEINGNLLIVHNSYDHREFFEKDISKIDTKEVKQVYYIN